MATTRKVKDAKDLSTNELIYFKGHAKATYMSDGTTVEDAINNIEVGTGTDLSDYATKEELSSKQNTITDLEVIRQGAAKGATALQSYTEQYKGTVTGVKVNGTIKNPSNGVVDIGTVITDISSKANIIHTHTKSQITDFPIIPSKTSELTNDSGFITINDVPVLEIPEEYVTETELSQKGFLVGEEISDELDDVETNTYIKYIAQTLTEEQKNQVRENIGIPSVDYIISLFEELKILINNNSASDAIAVLDKAILDMHKLQ